jgi:hypothetical protein
VADPTPLTLMSPYVRAKGGGRDCCLLHRRLRSPQGPSAAPKNGSAWGERWSPIPSSLCMPGGSLHSTRAPACGAGPRNLATESLRTKERRALEHSAAELKRLFCTVPAWIFKRPFSIATARGIRQNSQASLYFLECIGPAQLSIRMGCNCQLPLASESRRAQIADHGEVFLA